MFIWITACTPSLRITDYVGNIAHIAAHLFSLKGISVNFVSSSVGTYSENCPACIRTGPEMVRPDRCIGNVDVCLLFSTWSAYTPPP